MKLLETSEKLNQVQCEVAECRTIPCVGQQINNTQSETHFTNQRNLDALELRA